jgi:hypothetical protein
LNSTRQSSYFHFAANRVHLNPPKNKKYPDVGLVAINKALARSGVLPVQRHPKQLLLLCGSEYFHPLCKQLLGTAIDGLLLSLRLLQEQQGRCKRRVARRQNRMNSSLPEMKVQQTTRKKNKVQYITTKLKLNKKNPNRSYPYLESTYTTPM